jgi:Spy/CpxP family protein refolding chaperone
VGRSATKPAPTPPTGQDPPAPRVEQLTKDLGLTSAQSQQLDTILSQIHAKYKAIHDQSDAQLAQEREKGRDEIRTILTPEQKPKFEEFLHRLDEERKRNAAPQR